METQAGRWKSFKGQLGMTSSTSEETVNREQGESTQRGSVMLEKTTNRAMLVKVVRTSEVNFSM